MFISFILFSSFLFLSSLILYWFLNNWKWPLMNLSGSYWFVFLQGRSLLVLHFCKSHVALSLKILLLMCTVSSFMIDWDFSKTLNEVSSNDNISVFHCIFLSNFAEMTCLIQYYELDRWRYFWWHVISLICPLFTSCISISHSSLNNC